VGKKGNMGQAVMNCVNEGRPGIRGIVASRVLANAARTVSPCLASVFC